MLNPHQKSALVLWALTIPGHILVLGVIELAGTYSENVGHTTQTPIFLVVYMIAAILQVGILGGCCETKILGLRLGFDIR